MKNAWHTRSGTLTVAGSTTGPATAVTVNTSNAVLYPDATFASTNHTLANGTNTFTAIAKDTYGRVDTNSASVYLPASSSFVYDLNGNMLSDGRRGFEYDDENQLIRVTVTNWWKSEFQYDGKMRRRVRMEATWVSGAWVTNTIVRYIYDNNLVLQERWFNPQVSLSIPVDTVSYTRGRDLSGSLEGAGGIGGLLSRSSGLGGQLSHAFYHADGNGNITALINVNQVLVAQYRYDPYGNILSQNGPLADANLYRFSSKEWHHNSGLVYYLYRYYDPGLQRWLNRDPIGEWGGLNLYQFVANSPLYYVDPYGLHWTDYVPNWIFPAANFSAGMGDALTFNLTDHARNWMDIDQVNHCSGWYKGGEVAGTALSFALPAGGVSKVAGGADRVLIGTAESGIYRFAGRTGRNYIGQSGDIATRLGRHASTGKLPPGVNPTTWEVWGGRLARERAEQQLINKEGLRNLENIVNPLGGRPGLYHYVPTVGEAAAAGAAVGAGVGALKGGCNE